MTLKSAGLAVALLTMALGTAAADPWRENTGAPRAHAAPPPGVVGLTYDIVVNKFGRKIRGSAGTSVSNEGIGTNIPLFPIDVTKCVYVATLGRATTDGGTNETAGFITVVRSGEFTNGVFVQTFGLGSRLRNRPFHLLVAC